MNVVSIRSLLRLRARRLSCVISMAATLLWPASSLAQIGLDVVTNIPYGTGDRTISHAPLSASVKGVVLLVHSPAPTYTVLGATYGGVPMTHAPLSPALVAGEGGWADIWFLGTGVPQGTQNVVIDLSGTQATVGAIISLTATADTQLVDTKKVENTSIANPSVTLVTPAGVETFVCGVLFSGRDAVTNITPGTGYTAINEHDYGTETGGTSRRTSNATGGNVIYDWVQSADDAAMIAIAIRQSSGGGPPPAPTGLVATAVSSSQIDLSWTDVAGETSYKIERSPAGAGTWTQVGTNVADDVTFSDTGLPASTSFDYRVKASNAGGDSAPSNVASATTLAALPPAPTGLTATAVSSSQIDLTWTDVAGETSYKIERSPAGAGTWTQVGTNAANDVTFSDTGLPASTSFDYRVKASNAAGDSAPSNVASATTLAAPPPAPTGLTATAVSSSDIYLVWTDVVGETSYKIERSPAGAGTWTQVGTNAANDVDFLDGGLPASTSFDYRVKASNASGDSGPSNVASATTDSGQIALDVVTSIGYGSGDRTISHAVMSSNVRGILVLVFGPAPTYPVLGVTYGGVPMTHAPLSPSLVGGEGGWADIWFLGTNVPQGTQNVFIDVSSTQATVGSIISLTAGTVDTQIVDTKKIENTSIANPSVTLVTPTGVQTFVCGALFSGRDGTNGITPGTDYTGMIEHDFGTETGGTSRRTNIATGGNVIYNWTQTDDEAAMIAIAIRASAGSPPPAPAGLTAAAVSSSQIDLTWTNVAGETSYKIERSPAGAGTWTQVGTNAADDVTFSDTGLPASTSFDYRVKASNANGDSAPSNVASATTLSSGYSFPTTAYRFPLFAGVVNVRDYGATGNGTTDDTAAILNAITSNTGNFNRPSKIIYFPNGVYLVSDRLVRRDAAGNWYADFILQGETEAGTFIRLKPNSAGYGSADTPKAVIYQSSYNGYTDWATTGNGVEGFRNYICDLTIEIGSGNPGAVGISAMTHNNGAIRRVTVKGVSGYSGFRAGFDFTRPDQGPMLCHRITAIGGQYGIDYGRFQMCMSFEHVKLQGQTVAGIRNDNGKIFVRGIVSDNTVPVVTSSGTRAGPVIIDAVLDGGSSSESALKNATPGKLFARNVKTTGYARAINDGGVDIAGVNVGEYATGPKYSLWPKTVTSLNLPILDTPEKPYPTLTNMTNVADFGVTPESGSQSAALQNAIDSGAETLYFPSGTGRYFLGSTVIIRGNVKHIIFNHAWFEPTGTAFNNGASPVFRIASTVSGPIVFERGRWYNAAAVIPVFVWENATGQTVVIKDWHRLQYRNTAAGAGDLFLEGANGGQLVSTTAQKIWSRHHNTEGATNTGIQKTGGDMWILGLKTEARPLFEFYGGRVELLGGFRLDGIQGEIPVDQAAFAITDAQCSLVYCSLVTGAGTAANDYTVHVRETRGAETRELLRSSLERHGNAGSWVPLFRDGN